MAHYERQESITFSGARSARDWFAIGFVAEKQGRRAEAILNYRYAVEADPDSAPPRFNLGLLLRQEGDVMGSEVYLQDALRCDPYHVRARVMLGIQSAERDDWETAHCFLRQAQDIAPYDEHVLRALKVVERHLAVGKFAQRALEQPRSAGYETSTQIERIFQRL